MIGAAVVMSNNRRRAIARARAARDRRGNQSRSLSLVDRERRRQDVIYRTYNNNNSPPPRLSLRSSRRESSATDARNCDGQGNDVGAAAIRNVIVGMPPTSRFSGNSQYPTSSFVDPENEWENDDVSIDVSESEDDDFSFSGDNWSDRDVALECERYLNSHPRNAQSCGPHPWSDTRRDWLSGCLERRGGMSLDEQDRLPVVRYSSPLCALSRMPDAKVCLVCLEEFLPKSDLIVTGCRHGFHESCLRRWMCKSKQCPTCRTKVCVDSASLKHHERAAILISDWWRSFPRDQAEQCLKDM